MTWFLSLLVSSWDDILEFVADLHKNGISWGALITGLLLWNKMKRNKRLQDHDNRIEGKLDAIMEKVGARWDGPVNPSRNEEVENLRKLFFSLRRAMRQVNQSRRVRLLKTLILALTSSFSKKLAALIITAAISALNEKFGLDLSPEAIYGLYGVTIAYIAGQSHVDAKKIISKATNSIAAAVAETAVTTDGTDIKAVTAMPMSYDEMLPYLQDISNELGTVYDALKSGKYNDQTQHAVNVAMTLHEYLTKQSKGA